MATFKRKPTTIEAVQFDGTVASFNKAQTLGAGVEFRYDGSAPVLMFPSALGTGRADVGDWVCQHDDGTLGSCASDMFEELYEPVED